jgi:hypothetical protein
VVQYNIDTYEAEIMRITPELYTPQQAAQAPDELPKRSTSPDATLESKASKPTAILAEDARTATLCSMYPPGRRRTKRRGLRAMRSIS